MRKQIYMPTMTRTRNDRKISPLYMLPLKMTQEYKVLSPWIQCRCRNVCKRLFTVQLIVWKYYHANCVHVYTSKIDEFNRNY